MRAKKIKSRSVEMRLVPQDRFLFERPLSSTIFVDIDELLNYGALPLFFTIHNALQFHQVEHPGTESPEIMMVNDNERMAYGIYYPTIVEASAQHKPNGRFTVSYSLNHYGQHICNMIKRAMIISGEREIIVSALSFYAEVIKAKDRGYNLKFVTNPPRGGIVIPIFGHIPTSER